MFGDLAGFGCRFFCWRLVELDFWLVWRCGKVGLGWVGLGWAGKLVVFWRFGDLVGEIWLDSIFGRVVYLVR